MGDPQLSRFALRRAMMTGLLRAGLVAAALLMGNAAVGEEGENGNALAELRAKGTIEIAVYADYPPYSSGNAGAGASGIDVDLARAIAQKLGLKLKLRMVAAGDNAGDDLRNHVWKGHYLGGGVADVMLHVGYDTLFAKQQPNVVLFAPYFHDSVVIAYNTNRIRQLQSPIALTEHKIGVEGDTISDHIMSSAYGGALRTAAVREPSLKDAVNALGAGEVDGVMGPQGELQGLLAEHPVRDIAYHAQEPVGLMRTSWDVGIAIKNTGEQSLSDAVDQAVRALKADGSLKKMFTAHGVTYTDAAAPPHTEAKL
jgi:polar amino acid transport system substrate-binding protein